jgi:hypothetical protein
MRELPAGAGQGVNHFIRQAFSAMQRVKICFKKIGMAIISFGNLLNEIRDVRQQAGWCIVYLWVYKC